MEKTIDFDNTTSTIKSCIVEFQSFVGNSNEFIVKELSILDLATNVTWYFLFKPPHSFRRLNGKAARTNKWLINNYHHIAWNEGFIEYSELEGIVKHYCSKFSHIYTTGDKKSEWLQQYTSAKVLTFPLSKREQVYIGDGFCLSTRDVRHATTNCALIKTYRILSSMGKNNDTIGGGKDYINSIGSTTMHEYYSSQRSEHLV